jgi:hypothetical protein
MPCPVEILENVRINAMAIVAKSQAKLPAVISIVAKVVA